MDHVKKSTYCVQTLVAHREQFVMKADVKTFTIGIAYLETAIILSKLNVRVSKVVPYKLLAPYSAIHAWELSNI